MPEDFRWSFELVDKVSASASRMERSLVNIERALTRTQGTARAGTGSWAMFGLKMGAVAGIASEVTKSLIELGGQVLKMGATGAQWALQAGSFNENTQLSLEAILGSASAAQKAVSAWGALAERTPFDVRNVIEWGKQLTIAGESVENTVTVLKAVSDLGAKLGSTPEKQREIAEQTVGLFSRIKQLGSEASMRNLRGFADLGIPLGKMEQNLADRLTGGNIPQLKKLMETARSTGQDISHEIVLAALQAVQDTTGKLGALGGKGADTMSSHMTRLGQRLEFDIFKGIENTKGYKAVDKILVNLIEIFGGKGIKSSIRSLSDALGEALKPLTTKEGKERMEAFFTSMLAWLEKIIPSAGKVAHAIDTIGRVFEGAKISVGQGKPSTGTAAGAAASSAAFDAAMPSPGQALFDYFHRAGQSFPGKVPAPYINPTIHVANTIHVHGNANTDDLLLKIDASTQEALEAYFDRMGLHAGAQ